MSFFKKVSDKIKKVDVSLNVKNNLIDEEKQKQEKILKYKETVINFGKFKGSKIWDMVTSNKEEDIKYLEWIYNNGNFNNGLKKIIEELFNEYLKE